MLSKWGVGKIFFFVDGISCITNIGSMKENDLDDH